MRVNDFQRSLEYQSSFSPLRAVFAFIRAKSRLILRSVSAAAFVVVLLLSPGPGSAQEPSLDDVLGGFDDTATSNKADAPQEPSTPSMLELNGSLALSAASNIHQHQSLSSTGDGTDYSGLSRLRFTLDLNLDAKFSKAWDANVRGRGFYDAAYSINGRGEYTDQVISSLESEVELREAFIRGKVLPSLDVKLGRQIVVWGKSDNLRVTDVLNPLDNREPGMVDIEDLRLPLFMARADWYAGRWNVTAIAIPEIRFNKNPVYGSDFYPALSAPPQEVIPDDGGSNTEYAFALNGILTGWDISFYLARIFDDRASARLIPPQLVHNRVTMAGAAVNVALGNWLLKSEGAYFSGLRFAALPDRTFERADVLLGVEYTGFNETTVSLEAVKRHLRDYDEILAEVPDSTRQDEVQTAFRFQRDFLNDRVHLMLLALTSGWKGRDGKVQRLQVEYELTDAVALTGGIVNYGAGNRPEFRNIGKNDRVFFEAKYSF